MKLTIKTFDGGYGRIGKIWIEQAKCEICGKEKPCISSDASEGEYNHIYICNDCITSEINKAINKKNK